jgi:serine-aspartate repeat-containing protein C/D/E
LSGFNNFPDSIHVCLVCRGAQQEFQHFLKNSGGSGPSICSSQWMRPSAKFRIKRFSQAANKKFRSSSMKKSWLSNLRALAHDAHLSQPSRRKMTDAKKRRVAALESLESRQLLTGDFAGAVFNDLNVNGINDSSDPGLAGWTVFADINSDGQFNAGEPSTVTDVKGKFTITGLPVRAVTFYEVVQPGFSPTPGFTDHKTITIREGRVVKSDFPNVTAPVVTGNITGTVFEDDIENGIKESGEHGLTGWTMFVDTNGDGLLSDGEPTALTDTDGDYLFTDIPGGPATVYEIPVGGPQPTVGGLFPLEGASDHHVVTVVAGGTARTDFANLTPQVGTIQGIVWSDTNGDGLRGATENPLTNRPVYIDLNNNGIQEATEPSRLTDASGAYSFANIRTGTYRVSEVVPAGWSTSEGRPASVTTTVFIGGLNVVDFFNLIPVAGSISGSLWDDADGNGLRSGTEAGLSGWQVYLDLNTNGIRDAVEPQVTTNSDGSYAFSDVAYGTKTVREIIPANWFATNPSTGARTFRVLSGQNNAGIDFGNRERVGSITGSVWNDSNGDRLHSATEAGLADWTVYLDLNSDGVKDAAEPSVLSDANGNYVFNRLPLGTYRVTEVVPAGWITAVGKPNSVSATVVLGGIQVVDYFNLVPVTGTVSGTVFNDPDANGSINVTESGLEGWKVYADLNGNGAPEASEPSATTDAAGLYTITGVPYGNVSIREVVTPGYRATNLTAGLSTLLLNGENRTGVNFGNLELSEFVISGTAFSDSNRNGTLDLGERGLSGITVYIDANNNGILDPGEPSTVTLTDRYFTPDVNEAGTYSFSHLARGSYTVREIVPLDQLPTPAAAQVQTVTVPSFASSNANFANIFRENEIHGVVYDDTDADGVKDPGEYGRSGVTVYIDLNRDDAYDADEPEAVTGADGEYSFTSLTPGAFIVREKSGFVGPHTYPTTGGGILWPTGVSHAAVGNVTPTSITTSLAAGESYNQTVSITLPGTGSISNMVDVFLLFDDTGSFTANSPIVRAAFPTIISTLQAALPGIDLGFGVGRFEEYGNFGGETSVGRPFILNQPIVESTRPGFSASIQAALDRMAPGFGGDGPETDIEALYQVVTGLGFDGNNNGTVSDSGVAGLASTQLTPGNSGDVPAFSSFTTDPSNNVLASAGNVGGAGFRPGALPVILTATDIGFAYQPHGETTITGAGGLTLPVSALTQSSRATTPFSSGAGLQETVTGLNTLGALVIGLGTNPDASIDPRQGLEALAKLTGAVNQSSATIANGTADPIAPGDPFYFQISSGFGSTVADGVTNAIQNAVTNVAMDITLRSSDPRVRIINHTGTLTGIGGGQTASFDVEFVGDGRPSRFDLQFVRQGTEVILGSIPVVLGTPVAGEAYSYDDLEDGEIHRSSHFGHYIENVAPSFVGGSDQTLTEDAGTITVTGWATEISAGAATESGQTLNFVVTNSNPTLFGVQPFIAADGTLTFTPAANASGQAVVTVVLHDNGGVGISGADTSAPQSLLIDITDVNDAPVVADDAYSMFQMPQSMSLPRAFLRMTSMLKVRV